MRRRKRTRTRTAMCPSFHRISPPHARVPLVHHDAHWVRHGAPSDVKKRKRNQRTK
jgi:hypothetical protein